MNYGKLTAGTTKTAIDTAKPSEKGEIITYLSRMGDVLEQVADRGKLVIALGRINVVRNCYKTDIVLREKFFGQAAHLNVITSQAAEVFLCQVGTKKFLRIYKPFIGGQPPVNGLHVN